MIHPDSTFKGFIDFVSFALIFVVSLYMPFVFCFDIDTKENRKTRNFELFTDSWFLFELVLTFFEGYY